MVFTIDQVTLQGFGAPDPASGGTPAIVGYDGSPLYCHVTRAAGTTDKVAILIDQNPPHTFLADGPVARVTVTYVGDQNPITMDWTQNLPDGPYRSGSVLSPYLKFSADMQTVTVVLEQAAAKTVSAKDDAAPSNEDIPTIGLVVIGPDLTLTNPRGYFVNVPVHKDSDFRSITLARVKWPKEDGLSGPIGSLDVP